MSWASRPLLTPRQMGSAPMPQHVRDADGNELSYLGDFLPLALVMTLTIGFRHSKQVGLPFPWAMRRRIVDADMKITLLHVLHR